MHVDKRAAAQLNRPENAENAEDAAALPTFSTAAQSEASADTFGTTAASEPPIDAPLTPNAPSGGELFQSFGIETPQRVEASYERLGLSVLPALEALDRWCHEKLENGRLTAQERQVNRAIRKFIGHRIAILAVEIEDADVKMRWETNSKLKEALEEFAPLLLTAQTAQLLRREPDFAARVREAPKHTLLAIDTEDAIATLHDFAESEAVPRELPSGLLGSPSFWSVRSEPQRRNGFRVASLHPQLREFAEGTVRPFAFIPKFPVRDVTFLQPADSKTESDALVYYLAACILQSLPVAGAPFAIAVDSSDVVDQEDATLAMLKEAGLVSAEYHMDKDWLDHALAGIGLAGTVAGLQGATRIRRIASALYRLKDSGLRTRLTAALYRLGLGKSQVEPSTAVVAQETQAAKLAIEAFLSSTAPRRGSVSDERTAVEDSGYRPGVVREIPRTRANGGAFMGSLEGAIPESAAARVSAAVDPQATKAGVFDSRGSPMSVMRHPENDEEKVALSERTTKIRDVHSAFYSAALEDLMTQTRKMNAENWANQRRAGDEPRSLHDSTRERVQSLNDPRDFKNESTVGAFGVRLSSAMVEVNRVLFETIGGGIAAPLQGNYTLNEFSNYRFQADDHARALQEGILTISQAFDILLKSKPAGVAEDWPLEKVLDHIAESGVISRMATAAPFGVLARASMAGPSKADAQYGSSIFTESGVKLPPGLMEQIKKAKTARGGVPSRHEETLKGCPVGARGFTVGPDGQVRQLETPALTLMVREYVRLLQIALREDSLATGHVENM